MVCRQRGAAYFFHLRARGIPRKSRGNIRLFLQLVGVFALGGAGTKSGREFRHRFFRSLLLRLGRWLIRTGFRAGLRTWLSSGLSSSRGPYNGIYDLLCAWNKNPRKGALLVGGFVLLVVIVDVAVANLTGLFLQRAAQFLGKNLHARKIN